MASTGSIDTKTWLIVGASRGIGAEFVRQLQEAGQNVLLTVRDLEAVPVFDGIDKAKTRAFTCDMLSESSICSFVKQLQEMQVQNIDQVVVNAGVLKYPNRATEISYDNFALHLHTNTIGPIFTAQKLLGSRIPIGTITFMSSDSGSTARFREFEDGFAAYAASKAALNQTLRASPNLCETLGHAEANKAQHMAAELRRKGSRTIILAMHPGEVETDMANIELGWEIEGGQMTPQQSVSAMLQVIPSKTLDDSGTFWTWENKPYPW